MRRFVLPVVLLLVVVSATVQTRRAENRINAGPPVDAAEIPGLATPIVSARRASDWVTAPQADAALTDTIRDALANVEPETQTCVVVGRDGELLASSNTAAGFPTGEFQRLITAIIIDQVGSSSGFRTQIAFASDTEVVLDDTTGQSRLVGDVYLIGGGDPGLATADYASRFGEQRVFTSFDALADTAIAELQARGITSIQGRIVGDDSKYAPSETDYVNARIVDEGRQVRVWSSQQRDTNVVGPLSALLVNDGFESWPAELGNDASNRRASNPARMAATVLDNRFEAAGISISRSPTTGDAPALSNRVVLSDASSPPLDSIIRSALANGTTAEMLFKEYGIRSGGSAERASVAYLLAIGGLVEAGLPYDVDDSAVTVVDGSGLSSLNRTSCEFLHASIADTASIGAQILPAVADSTVAACVENDGLRVLAVANAGTTGLVGWQTTPNGEQLTFAVLAQDPNRPANDPFTNCNSLQLEVLAAITAHPNRPNPTELAPRAVQPN
jgi:D-alanyl-D-alanine carboxypeptidase